MDYYKKDVYDLIKILLSGCDGKMGQVVTKHAEQYDDLKIVAGYDIADKGANPYPVYADLDKCAIRPDVMIDFSNPAALEVLLSYSVKNGIPAVIATTGFSSPRSGCLKKFLKVFPCFSRQTCRLASTF